MEQPTLVAKQVLYCANCGMPPEYCEFGSTLAECKTWLKITDDQLYDRLYGAAEQAAAEKLATLDLNKEAGESVQGSADASAASAAAAASSSAEDPPSQQAGPSDPAKQSKKKPQVSKKVILTTIERTKRKRVTIIVGLEKFDVDLKKAAKMFATKFACGASVTKNASGQDEIVVQGEFADDIFELITETWPAIDEDSIEFGETKTKK